MTALPRHALTHQEYLEWEAFQEYKSEFYTGEVFAQAGASSAHVTVTLNLGTMLYLI